MLWSAIGILDMDPNNYKNRQAIEFPNTGLQRLYWRRFGFLQPTALFVKEGVKIGVIGICAMIVDKVMPEKMSKGLRFTSGIEELPKYIKQLKGQGADIIVLLSHNGFPQDVELLKNVDGIDICLSAHTHNRIYSPIVVNGTRIAQCGCHGAFVGNFHIHIEQKKIKNCDYELIKVDGSAPKSSEVDTLVQKVLTPYEEIRTCVLGRTNEILHRYNATNSTMDNFLLKAIAHVTKTDIAFSNGWRYGAQYQSEKLLKMTFIILLQ